MKLATRIQGDIYRILLSAGWKAISGPFTDNSPCGGPVYFMNDRQQLIYLDNDGQIYDMNRGSKLDINLYK